MTKRKSIHLPLFECFLKETTPSDKDCDQPVEMATSKQINIDGIKMKFHTDASKIKQNVNQLKKRILSLEKLMEKLEVFERNEIPRIATKVKKVLANLNEQELDYTYDLSISAYNDEIFVSFSVNANEKIDDSFGEVVSKVFDSPSPRYNERNSDTSWSVEIIY